MLVGLLIGSVVVALFAATLLIVSWFIDAKKQRDLRKRMKDSYFNASYTEKKLGRVGMPTDSRKPERSSVLAPFYANNSDVDFISPLLNSGSDYGSSHDSSPSYDSGSGYGSDSGSSSDFGGGSSDGGGSSSSFD